MSLHYDPAKKIARDKERARVKDVEYVEPVRPYSSLSRGKKKVRPQSPERAEQQSQGRKGSQLQREGARGKRLGPKDRKASERCKELAFHTCAMQDGSCCATLDPHHVIKRRHQKVRFDQRNLVCLCRVHHNWAEEHETEFLEIFEQMRPGVYDTVRALAFGFEPAVMA